MQDSGMHDRDFVPARDEPIGVLVDNPETSHGSPGVTGHQKGDLHVSVGALKHGKQKRTMAGVNPIELSRR